MGQLIKPLMLIVAPVESMSGYGSRARDLVKAILSLYSDTYDIAIQSISWGAAPMTALNDISLFEIKNRILRGQLNRQPDVCVMVTIPQEFKHYAVGKYNIGFSAGIETTATPSTWIEGCNVVNLNVVSSEFSKAGYLNSQFTVQDRNGHPAGLLKVERPVEVLFEGIDTRIYNKNDNSKFDLSMVTEDFAFILVGHWLQGDLGCDRKDIGMTVKLFLETFKDMDNAPALILKVQVGSYSQMDLTEIQKRVEMIKSSVKADKLPSVYLIHGNLTDFEMNELYNHPKVKSMVLITKGEGFGRPLLEFSVIGKPILTTGWSGHLDFLNKDYSFLLPGKLEDVPPSAVNDFIIKEGKWFNADYNVVADAMKNIFNQYDFFMKRAKKLMYDNKTNFSLTAMQNKLQFLFNKYLPKFPQEVQLEIPAPKFPDMLSKFKKVEQENNEVDNG